MAMRPRLSPAFVVADYGETKKTMRLGCETVKINRPFYNCRSETNWRHFNQSYGMCDSPL